MPLGTSLVIFAADNSVILLIEMTTPSQSIFLPVKNKMYSKYALINHDA